MDDLLADFIEESREMLEASAGEIVAWEANPADRARLDTIFRFVHTVKGNCGFFDLPRLERLSHAAEDALADVRNGRREPDAALVTAVLSIIDRISQMIDALDAGEEFPEGGDDHLIAALSEDNAETPAAKVESDPADQSSTAGIYGSSGAAGPALRSIRLPVELLDRVMSGVSDMVLARNELAHRLREAGNQPTVDGPFERLTSILADVRDAATRMRLQRIDQLFGAFPRLVRDLSHDLGKQVMIEIDGGDVELDREMIELIRDPMTHIIRNAIDHGIEPPAQRLKAGKREIGLLSIAARQSGNTISIIVSDDGKGLDEAKIAATALKHGLVSKSELENMSPNEVLQLVFAPGLSTADQVTAISGRGVGLDVVRSNLEKIGGTIQVASTPGAGSLFTLRIPLTLSIIAGITVEAAGQHYAIPQGFVEEILHGASPDLDTADLGDARMITFRGARIPCLDLSKILELGDSQAGGRSAVVILRLARGTLFALAVDAIDNHGDLVVKPLAPMIMRNKIFAGSTLLEDGRPILLLDIHNIADRHGLVANENNGFASARLPAQPEAAREDFDHAMLFRDCSGARRAIRLDLVQRIETVPSEAIDDSAATPRIVIDGHILPLVGWKSGQPMGETLRLLRLSDGSCELCYAISAIEDTAALESEIVPVADEPLIEAMTIIAGESVALLDGHELFARFGALPRPTSRFTCHLPEGDWARTILAPLVKAAGYEPVQASETADITILLDQMPAPANVAQVIRLRSLPEDHTDAAEAAQSIYRYDRDAVLRALRAASKEIAA